MCARGCSQNDGLACGCVVAVAIAAVVVFRTHGLAVWRQKTAKSKVSLSGNSQHSRGPQRRPPDRVMDNRSSRKESRRNDVVQNAGRCEQRPKNRLKIVESMPVGKTIQSVELTRFSWGRLKGRFEVGDGLNGHVKKLLTELVQLNDLEEISPLGLKLVAPGKGNVMSPSVQLDTPAALKETLNVLQKTVRVLGRRSIASAQTNGARLVIKIKLKKLEMENLVDTLLAQLHGAGKEVVVIVRSVRLKIRSHLTRRNWLGHTMQKVNIIAYGASLLDMAWQRLGGASK